ncbi:hypothetical protein J2Z69_000369 [Paenibacillus shirakamiensis]|uniref:Uncharacterized protein n=1 Tax=Paenibacillus shirakamiensis TaxID=1265935 RepID=A0ABS4JCE6_9BACL|nr:hypothetical protein [Paenibacillus shirakamiensis]MBP1999350.1 hypothetical protein [Paenibacillus shirakamiensis]
MGQRWNLAWGGVGSLAVPLGPASGLAGLGGLLLELGGNFSACLT